MTIRRLASKVVAKLFSHKDPQIDREFTNVYAALARLDMGNFSWNYDKENKRLILQVLDENTGEAVPVVVFREDTKDAWAVGSFFNSYTGGAY